CVYNVHTVHIVKFMAELPPYSPLCIPPDHRPSTELTKYEQNSPFVGLSGTRLFSWLRQAGLEESWIREYALVFQRYLCYPGKRPDGE
ncbi:MAG: hypothetical protein R6U51_01690, partial [Anaerolineales bacterium]